MLEKGYSGDPRTFAEWGPWPCPNCGADSTYVHKCSECGRSLLKDYEK